MRGRFSGQSGNVRPRSKALPVGVTNAYVPCPMGKAKQPAAQGGHDIAERVARARAQVEAEGAVKLTALGPASVRSLVAAELATLGFEVTKSAVRKPVIEQLQRAFGDGAFVSLKGVAARVAGATAAEAKKAALELLASGAAHLVLRGKEEVLVPASASVLSRKELAAFEAVAKLVAKAAKAKNGLSLLRADLAEALERALPPSQSKPTDVILSNVLSAVDATRDAHTGLSFVPSIVERLRPSLTSDAARDALLRAANSGVLELRPEGGINRLSAEELTLCPPGPQGTRLSWARRTENVTR